MPDLTPETHAQCITSIRSSIEIGDYTLTLGPENLGECQVNWHCPCKGFKYRGACRHVKLAEEQNCGWMEFIDGGDVKRDGNGDPVCPKCGGPVEYRTWMV